MTKTEFQQLIGETYHKMQELTDTKGEEYSRSDDQLANFKRSAAEAGINPYQVWLVFFNKHKDAIVHFVQHGQTFSEPIESRIDDALLYLLLLKGMIRESERTGL